MTEGWRDVVGYEEYFMISSFGNVFSKRTNKILKQNTTDRGYKTVATKIGGRSGKNLCFKIHRLVAEAFIENFENKPYVNHINSKRNDNRVENLEWCTAKENFDHGLSFGNIKNNQLSKSSFVGRKLKDDDVINIRNNYVKGCHKNGLRALARKYGVNKNTIKAVVSSETYKDIGERE